MIKFKDEVSAFNWVCNGSTLKCKRLCSQRKRLFLVGSVRMHFLHVPVMRAYLLINVAELKKINSVIDIEFILSSRN